MSGVGEGAVAPVGVEGVDVVGEVGDEEIEVAVAVVVPRVDAHARLGAAVLAVGQTRGGADFAEAESALVAEEEVRLGVVGHVDVGVAVGVEIGEHHPEARQAVPGDPGRVPGRREPAAAEIAVEAVGLAGDPLGPAVAAQPLVPAPEPAAGGIVEIELHVVDHVEVQEPVAVEIPEGGARAPAAVVHPRRPPGLGEGLSAAIEVEAVGAPVGDVEIGVAVVVGVAHGAAHAPAGVGEAELRRRLLEERGGPGSAVAVEAVAGGFGGIFEAGAVHQEEVLVAVALDVEEGGAGGDRLEDVALLGAPGDVLVVDAALSGHVDEVRGRLLRGGGIPSRGRLGPGRGGGGHGLGARPGPGRGGRARPVVPGPPGGGLAPVRRVGGGRSGERRVGRRSRREALRAPGGGPGIGGAGDGEEGQENRGPPAGSP